LTERYVEIIFYLAIEGIKENGTECLEEWSN